MLLTINSSGRVLDLFTAMRPEWGVTEVAAELALSKSKAHALLASLCDVGLLQRTDRSRYRLGWRLAGLTRVLADTTDFHRAARPVLDALCARFDETINLAVLSAGQVVYVDRVLSSRPSGPGCVDLGGILPAHCTAAGKLLLASLTDPEHRQVLAARGLARRTAATISNEDDLTAELIRVREQRLAWDREETIRGVACVAAPVIDADGACVAAISISAPVFRFLARQRIYEVGVRRAGDYVSRQLAAHAVEQERARPALVAQLGAT